MRVLFSVNNFGFLRNFEPALRELAARGHDIHLLAERKDSVGGTRTIDNLVAAHPDRITFSYAPGRKEDFWQALAIQVRLCLDYWRYLDARYDESPSLRARAARQAPAFASRLPRMPIVGSRLAMGAWDRLFRAIERTMPPGETADAGPRRTAARSAADDAAAVFRLAAGRVRARGQSRRDPLCARRRQLGSPDDQGPHPRTPASHGRLERISARRGGRASRDRSRRWSASPVRRPTTTGSCSGRRTTREDFGVKVGVPPDRPLLLYLCSSPFITPYEVGFVRKWIEAVRHAPDPQLRRAAILIRPHPQNAAQWADFDPSVFDAVGIWPRAGANPVDTDARADYFDSMFHSVAMVGVNTSALIESGIVGRPVFTVLADRVRRTAGRHAALQASEERERRPAARRGVDGRASRAARTRRAR